MDKVQKKLFSLFSQIISEDENETALPQPVRSRIQGYYLIAVCILILGIAIAIIAADGINIISALAFPLILALMIAMYGFVISWSIKKHGYISLKGECIDHELSILKSPISRGYISGMIIRTEDNVIEIPTTKTSFIVPVGESIRVYLPYDAITLSRNGVDHYSKIYGYEIVSKKTDSTF